MVTQAINVKDTVVSGGNVLDSVKNAVLWAGRMIQTGFTKLGSLIQSAWDKTIPFLKSTASSVGAFFRTGPGIATIGFTAAIALWATSNSNCLRGEDLALARIALRVAALACFVGAGVGIGLAISKGAGTAVI